MIVNVGVFSDNYIWPIYVHFTSVLVYEKVLRHLNIKWDSIIDFETSPQRSHIEH